MKKNKVALWHEFIGSTFFLGKIKGGGTWSSILMGLILFFFMSWTSPYYFVLLASVLFISILLSFNLSEDPSWFTLDEITGLMVTFAFHNKNLSTFIIGIVLFRIFDIFKLPIIRKVEDVKIGIVLDDIIAGILASIFLFVLHSIMPL